MIQVETCRGCGRSIYVHPVANLTVRLDVEPLDAQTAVSALLAGRNLWRVTATSVTGARPAELSALRQRGTTEGPCIVQEHACTARWSPNTLSPVHGADASPKGREAGVQRFMRTLAGPSTPSSAPRTAPYGAHAAARRPSDARTHPCSACGAPVPLGDPEGYVLIHLGATLVDAFHATCP